jgi:hypothetical protein
MISPSPKCILAGRSRWEEPVHENSPAARETLDGRTAGSVASGINPLGPSTRRLCPTEAWFGSDEMNGYNCLSFTDPMTSTPLQSTPAHPFDVLRGVQVLDGQILECRVMWPSTLTVRIPEDPYLRPVRYFRR